MTFVSSYFTPYFINAAGPPLHSCDQLNVIGTVAVTKKQPMTKGENRSVWKGPAFCFSENS